MLPRPRPAHALVIAIAALLAAAIGLVGQTGADSTFAATVARLSEPGGYFDSNNLISNERSYLHVIPALHGAGLKGGAYLGVGPDQNFSYIAQVKPAVAFIIDIRRDNLLLHLLFKALFHLSRSRAEYLSLLFGRPPPSPGARWKGEDIEHLAQYIDVTPPGGVDALRRRVDTAIRGFGVPLTDDDLATIDRFHRTFIDRGMALKFESAGRPPRSYYPTYRELLLETDMQGRRWNYLAGEGDFQVVAALQRRDLIIPVVGDLAGPTAVRAIGRLMAERGDRLSAFYTSNVEYYLSGGGAFDRFVANLGQIPRHERSVIIRSVFPNRFGWTSTPPGYYSASVVQRVDDLLAGASTGRIREYRDLLGGR